MEALVWIHIAGLFATAVWMIVVYAMEGKRKN